MTAEETDLRAAVTQASSSNADPQPHNLDLPAKTLHINLQELAKNFRPYNPPPVPIPMNFSDGPAPNMSQQIKWQLQTQPSTQKTYTTKLTIFESTYPSGRKIYKSHATPIVEEPAAPSAIPEAEEKLVYLPPSPRNQPFLGRMRKRQLQYMDRMGEVWSMISVKRQRKLKMKKHKYKKLMKRTKNLRRRLDRI